MIRDFLRFWWALLYWNARKQRFVWGKSRGAAPCQHPSDSGRAGETGCLACALWQEPARFRRVCPALRRGPAGWRCSWNAAEVRPLWGRALLAVAAAGVVLWLGGTAAAFGVLRAIGYSEVRYADFWSPHFRTRFREVQAGFYERQAGEAFRRGDFAKGVLALSVAYNRNPRNLGAGLLLAQLLGRTRQADLGDELFRRLLREHPEQAEGIAVTWSDAMLLRRDYSALARLAGERATAGGAGGGAWMRALVFAARQIDDRPRRAEVLRGAEEALAGRYPEVVAALRLEAAGDVRGEADSLRRAPPAGDAFAAYFRIERLLQLGDTGAAERELRRVRGLLGAFHADLLAMRAADQRQAPEIAGLIFAQLARPPLTPEKLEILAAELYRRPAPSRVGLLLEGVADRPDLARRSDLLAALAVAAAAGGERGQLERVLALVPADQSGLLGQLRELAAWAGGGREAFSLDTLLLGTPLPREVVYALQEKRR